MRLKKALIAYTRNERLAQPRGPEYSLALQDRDVAISNPESPAQSYLPGLDGLRALSVLAVLVYHANAAWLPGGFLGVEVFFVISGFIITRSLVLEWQRNGYISVVNETARRHVNKMAEFEAHNLALPGDVIVIEGVQGISNMGGISAQIGKRQGEAGAIVSGGIRDIAHSRSVGYPVWSSEVTPVTGKWRIETVEINGDVEIADVRVAPGDIVLADETGVCFVPRARAAEVLELARGKVAAEAAKCKAIDAGTPVPDLPGNA